MSEIRRTARDLLATLDATDAYLGVVSATRLFYASVVRVEVEAVRACEELLAEIGVEEGLDVVVLEEGTDELLAAVVNMSEEDPSWADGADLAVAVEVDMLETDVVALDDGDAEAPEAEAGDEEVEVYDDALIEIEPDSELPELEPEPLDIAETSDEDVGSVVEELGELDIEDEVTGLLIPPKDERALTDALRRVVTDGALRRKLGRAARERARSEFSFDAISSRVLALRDGRT